MSGISLTASMRNNLLGLQTTSKLMDLTQERLSTGKKVNSAIDNPSNFYAASSLSNRANDLNALLDSMGQAVLTIKAATEAIDSGLSFLDQAASITEQALSEDTKVPMQDKVILEDNFEELKAQGYKVVDKNTTFSEFYNMINSSNAKIVLAEDVSFDSRITFTQNNVTINGAGHKLTTNDIITISGSGVTITNAEIERTTAGTIINATSNNYNIDNVRLENNSSGTQIGIHAQAAGKINNVSISLNNVNNISSIGVQVKSNVDIGGLNVRHSGINSLNVGIYALSGKANVSSMSMVSERSVGYGILEKGGNVLGVNKLSAEKVEYENGKQNTDVIIEALGSSANAAKATKSYYVADAEDEYFGQGEWYLPTIAELIEMYGYDDTFEGGLGKEGVDASVGKDLIDKTLNTLSAKNNVDAEMLSGYLWSSSENDTNASEYAWLLNTATGNRGQGGKSASYGVRAFLKLENVYNSESGNSPKIGDIMYTDRTWSSADNYDESKTVAGVITSTNNGSVKIMSLKNITTTSWGPKGTDIAKLNNIDTAKMYVSVMHDHYVSVNDTNANFLEPDLTTWENQYNEVLTQYDNIVDDASYKGVNLLENESLEVRFNETKTSSMLIKGRDVKSQSLGMNSAIWKDISDVVNSVKELRSAINSLRSFTNELGNNYSVVQTRQNFTENLINVLTEGADKLTLADMNEESSNMLSLQTRQQLAVNALSLASQASQSVLKLF